MSLCEIMCNTTSVCVNACGVFILFKFSVWVSLQCDDFMVCCSDLGAVSLQRDGFRWGCSDLSIVSLQREDF